MSFVTASVLAERLGVSRARVSQYVSEGKLEGCFSGEGRARRFDLTRAMAALDRTLDLGQRMGNGAGTAEALRGAGAPSAARPQSEPAARPQPEPAAQIPRADPEADRYQRARADIAETRAIQDRLKLAELEGRYVLASEVELATRRALAAEIAEVETVLRTAAQKVAAELGLDAPTVRAVLVGEWRAHRDRRATLAAARAEAAEPSPAEAEEGADTDSARIGALA